MAAGENDLGQDRQDDWGRGSGYQVLVPDDLKLKELKRNFREWDRGYACNRGSSQSGLLRHQDDIRLLFRKARLLSDISILSLRNDSRHGDRILPVWSSLQGRWRIHCELAYRRSELMIAFQNLIKGDNPPGVS